MVPGNFRAEDADVLSRSMLLALDRSGGRLDEFLPIFSSTTQKLRHEERDWERFLLEEEFKYQDVPHAQVFDCTGISFGFFDDENQGVGNRLDTSAADPDEAVEILGKPAQRLSSLYSISDTRQNFSGVASSLLDISEFSSVFIEESPRISCTAPYAYLSRSCEGKLCERFESVKTYCSSRPDAECDAAKTPEAADIEQCMAAMLDEICGKMGGYCAASTLIRTADGEVSHEADLNISAITSGSGDCLERTISIASGDCLLDPQRSEVGEKTSTNLSSDWEELVSLKEEPTREQVLQELRTFTWALDTVEEWDDCPASVRVKVLHLALESRCRVIRKRAQRLSGNDMED
ncbi:hypothetical protein Y032_0373g193 [Ancylostoma ceylanicum]|uniref:Uncharacterized protein n=1 Tax=Ancylostoma ceylanicum TaxID=53326 RepID=A0A016RU60_9BILA|nr:hypothetical protein Y032_0373g193 [Ancylostoma ceylanicum]